MKKPLNQIPGTIAHHLTKHANELWACGNDVEAMKKVALKLLDDPTLTDKTAVANAKRAFQTSHPHAFMSTLVTYMTGDKVIN